MANHVRQLLGHLEGGAVLHRVVTHFYRVNDDNEQFSHFRGPACQGDDGPVGHGKHGLHDEVGGKGSCGEARH